MWRFLSITETYSYVDIFASYKAKQILWLYCVTMRERERETVWVTLFLCVFIELEFVCAQNS